MPDAKITSFLFPLEVQSTLEELTQLAGFTMSALQIQVTADNPVIRPQLYLRNRFHPGLKAWVDWAPLDKTSGHHMAAKLPEAAVKNLPTMMATAVRLL